ncbi:hypothetical protein PO909_029360 [Leuciscus waleckii]
MCSHSFFFLFFSCFCSVDRDDQTGDLQHDSHQPVDDELQRVKDQHKTRCEQKEKIKAVLTKGIAGIELNLIGDHQYSLHRLLMDFHPELKDLDSKIYEESLAYMIQMSEEVLDEFHPMKYKTPDEGRWRMIPAVINCRKALFAGCLLSDHHCESLSSILQSSNSHLRELNLSFNDLQDSGIKLLSAGLKSSLCQLNILRFDFHSTLLHNKPSKL